MARDWASGTSVPSAEPAWRRALFCPPGRRGPRDSGRELYVSGVGEGNESAGAKGEALTDFWPFPLVPALHSDERKLTGRFSLPARNPNLHVPRRGASGDRSGETARSLGEGLGPGKGKIKLGWGLLSLVPGAQTLKMMVASVSPSWAPGPGPRLAL